MHLHSGRRLALVADGEPAPALLAGDEVRKNAGTTALGVGGEAAGTDAGLRADERLHAAHGEVHLPPHLVAAHQRLQPHQAAQRAQGSPGLEPNKTCRDIRCISYLQNHIPTFV